MDWVAMSGCARGKGGLEARAQAPRKIASRVSGVERNRRLLEEKKGAIDAPRLGKLSGGRMPSTAELSASPKTAPVRKEFTPKLTLLKRGARRARRAKAAAPPAAASPPLYRYGFLGTAAGLLVCAAYFLVTAAPQRTAALATFDTAQAANTTAGGALCAGDAPASARIATWSYTDSGLPAGTHAVASDLEVPLRLSVSGCGEAAAAFVRDCFRGRHILIIGDSVSRYQYLSLAQFIAYESWTPFHGRGEPMSEVESVQSSKSPSWGSWPKFMAGTHQRLRGYEICDCFRGPNKPFHVENRYFFDPRANVRITFVSLVAPNYTRHHALEVMNVTCGSPGGCAQGGCSPEADDCGDPSPALLNYFSEEDAPGAQAQAAFLRRVVVGSARELAARVAPIDALVLNLGYFGGAGWPRDVAFEAPPASRDVYKAALLEVTGLLQKEGLAAHLVWRATTAHTNNDYENDVELEWVKGALLPLGWQLFDAFHLTQRLGEFLPMSVTDGIHFKPHVYRGLNEALAMQLCGSRGAPFSAPRMANNNSRGV